MWVAVIVGIYGYVILLSLMAVRLHVGAVHGPHHHHEHGGMGAGWHLLEQNLHQGVVSGLSLSLSIRTLQVLSDVTLWVVAPLTVGAALFTLPIVFSVLRMAREDFNNLFIAGLARLKTAVLLVCGYGILVDQGIRVAQLF